MNQSKRNIDPVIFGTSTSFLLILMIFALFDLSQLEGVLKSLQSGIVSNFSWLFIISVSAFVFYSFYLVFSKYANIRLGNQDSKPEYSTASWFAMLFSAGMGIGLVFYGVAEPIMHFSSPPFAEKESIAAARDAMRISIFHWGISAWAIYAILGLALAYSHFTLGLPLAIRSTLKPILGQQYNKIPGKLIDTLAILTTIFGLATSLGLGAAQINAGLNYLLSLEISTEAQIIIIVLITCCAGLSLVLGLDKGIRKLSEINILLALFLMLFVLFAGPTLFLLRGIPEYLGDYLQNFVGMSLFTDALGDGNWIKSWTVFYWAWWISWSPFVAIFVARISKGRTIREFILGLIFAPTLAGLVWFSIFGGAALHVELLGDGGIVKAVNENVSTAIFNLLAHYPFSQLSGFLAITVIAIFFITSSDSGSLVIDMLASGGKPSPPLWQKIYWVSAEGIVASILLLVGGLGALQAGAIAMGLPFCIVLIAVCFALHKNLNNHHKL